MDPGRSKFTEDIKLCESEVLEPFPSTSIQFCDAAIDSKSNSQEFPPELEDSDSESWMTDDEIKYYSVEEEVLRFELDIRFEVEKEINLPRLGVNKVAKKEYVVSRGKGKLRKGKFTETVSDDAAICMAATLGIMANELFTLSKKRAVTHLQKQRIEPIDILYALSFFDRELACMFPEAQINYFKVHSYDRDDDTSDHINLIAENILLDKFTNSFIRFCSSSLIWNGSISCRYMNRCVCQQEDVSSFLEYIDIDEPQVVIPAKPDKKKKKKKSYFEAKYHKLKNKKFAKKVRPDSTIYLKAVLQYLTEEILELAGHCVTAMPFGIRIDPLILSHAFISDRDIMNLYPRKNFSAGAVIFVKAVIKYLVREVLEWASLFAVRFRRSRIEPIDLLFSIECNEDLSAIFPSIMFMPERPNYTEIMRFSCGGDKRAYCCKRLVRSSEVVPDISGCSGMQLNKLPLLQNKMPARFEWSRGNRKKPSMQRKWLRRKAASRTTADAAVCWLAVTEFIATEVLKIAGNNALRCYWRRIEPVDILHGLKSYKELAKLYSTSQLSRWAKNKV